MAERLQAAQGIDPRSASRVGLTFGELCTDHYFPAVRNRKRSIKDDFQKFDRWLAVTHREGCFFDGAVVAPSGPFPVVGACWWPYREATHTWSVFAREQDRG